MFLKRTRFWQCGILGVLLLLTALPQAEAGRGAPPTDMNSPDKADAMLKGKFTQQGRFIYKKETLDTFTYRINIRSEIGAAPGNYGFHAGMSPVSSRLTFSVDAQGAMTLIGSNSYVISATAYEIVLEYPFWGAGGRLARFTGLPAGAQVSELWYYWWAEIQEITEESFVHLGDTYYRYRLSSTPLRPSETIRGEHTFTIGAAIGREDGGPDPDCQGRGMASHQLIKERTAVGLKDEPLHYQVAFGPQPSLALMYHSMETTNTQGMGSTHFGPGWFLPQLS